jgi:hypothetical protein
MASNRLARQGMRGTDESERSDAPLMSRARGTNLRDLLLPACLQALSLLRKDGEHDDEDEEHKNVWYESLDAFKPLSYRMHTGR